MATKHLKNKTQTKPYIIERVIFYDHIGTCYAKYNFKAFRREKDLIQSNPQP